MVCLSDDGMTILKCALAFNLEGCDEKDSQMARCREADSAMLLEREKQVYKHLGQYEGILTSVGISAIGLEFRFMKNGEPAALPRRCERANPALDEAIVGRERHREYQFYPCKRRAPR